MIYRLKNTFLVVIAMAVIGPLAVAQRKYPTNFGQAEPPAQTQTLPPTQAQPATPANTPEQQPPATSPALPAASAAPEAETTTAAAPAATNRKLSYDLQVSGAQQWTDTGIDLVPGDRVALTSEGTVDYGTNKAAPEGLPRSWREVISALPVNAAGVGALIGRLGAANVETPFMVGSKKDITATRSGRLFLGINQAASEAGTGLYKVKVQITPAAAKQTATASAKPIQLPSDFFSQVPRRVQDKDGNPGDMVNFVIIGPQEKMQKAFADAGWVLVDRTKTEAAMHALLSTYSKKVYTEMPMSELYLFGRPQDFGYAHAEPVQVVQTRHHLRIWKAEFNIDGQPVWIGAATHDIGFEHDNRSQSATAITHKIDPDIDKERDYVSETLNATGYLTAISKVTPPDPLREAQTATGGTFHSDGQVLVMGLN